MFATIIGIDNVSNDFNIEPSVKLFTSFILLVLKFWQVYKVFEIVL